jgi:molybdate transport system permease protein
MIPRSSDREPTVQKPPEETIADKDLAPDSPKFGPKDSDALPATRAHRVTSDWPFLLGLCILGGFYILLIVSMMAADAIFTSGHTMIEALRSETIQRSATLSLLTSLAATVMSLWVAVPIGYLMSRYRFPGKLFVDALLDIPIVLPPLVIGVSLLILFRLPPGQWVEAKFQDLTEMLFGRQFDIVFDIPAIILAQFCVAAAFAVRTLRTAFDEITPRKEQVALTLGCTRSQAFWLVVMPEARRGLLAAATLTWARSIGEFGPVLIFAGATRGKTEVLPTTVYLEFSVGDLDSAVAVSLLMVAMAIIVLVVVRYLGAGDPMSKAFR